MCKYTTLLSGYSWLNNFTKLDIWQLYWELSLHKFIKSILLLVRSVFVITYSCSLILFNFSPIILKMFLFKKDTSLKLIFFLFEPIVLLFCWKIAKGGLLLDYKDCSWFENRVHVRFHLFCWTYRLGFLNIKKKNKK